MDFEKLDELAMRQMGARKSHREREIGAVYNHGQRVARGVLLLRPFVTDDSTHDDTLRCAAMFHDIGKGLVPHERVGALLADDMLTGYMSEAEKREVSRLIGAHCDRKPNTDAHDMWVKLLQDADLLDHFGSQEVFMCFGVIARGDMGMSAAADYWRDHLNDTLERNASLLNFDVSRRVMTEKAAFTRAFYERFSVEARGEYWMGGAE